MTLTFSSLPTLEARFVDPLPITQVPEHSLLDTDNAPAQLGLDAGELLLVNFWATWCTPCVHELPTLAALSQHLADTPARLVLVNEDLQFSKGQDFLQQFDFHDNTRHLYDPNGKFLQSLKGRGLPISLLITPDGEIVRYAQGDQDWNRPEIRALLAEYLPTKTDKSWWQKLWD